MDISGREVRRARERARRPCCWPRAGACLSRSSARDETHPTRPECHHELTRPAPGPVGEHRPARSRPAALLPSNEALVLVVLVSTSRAGEEHRRRCESRDVESSCDYATAHLNVVRARMASGREERRRQPAPPRRRARAGPHCSRGVPPRSRQHGVSCLSRTPRAFDFGGRIATDGKAGGLWMDLARHTSSSGTRESPPCPARARRRAPTGTRLTRTQFAADGVRPTPRREAVSAARRTHATRPCAYASERNARPHPATPRRVEPRRGSASDNCRRRTPRRTPTFAKQMRRRRRSVAAFEGAPRSEKADGEICAHSRAGAAQLRGPSPRAQ